MEKDKSTISEELDHIRNSINQKNETKSDDDNFILLDKIVSKGTKYEKKTKIDDKTNNEDIQGKKNNITQNKIIKNNNKLNNPKKNIVNNISKPLKKIERLSQLLKSGLVRT